MELAIHNLPFYYRLKSDEDVKFEIPENYPFQFEYDNFGLGLTRRPKNLQRMVQLSHIHLGYIQYCNQVNILFRAN